LKKIFIQSEGQRLGPCSVEEVKSLLNGKWISLKNLGQYEGDNIWRPLASFPEFNEAAAIAISATAPANQVIHPPFPRRQILVVAGILAASLVIFFFAKTNYWEPVKPASEIPSRSQTTTPNAAKAHLFYDRNLENAGKTGLVNVSSPAKPDTNPIPSQMPPPAANASTNKLVVVSPTSRSITSTIDVQNAPFGHYDGQLIDLVRRRWLAMLAQQDLVHGRSGKVTIEFRLNYRGQISELKITQTEVDDALAFLCQRAVQEAGPFPAWPAALRQSAPQNTRTIRFTFTY
jgi:hypothetical protein